MFILEGLVFGTQLRPVICSLVYWVCWCAVRRNVDLPGLLPLHRVVSGAPTGTLKLRDSDMNNSPFFVLSLCVGG